MRLLQIVILVLTIGCASPLPTGKTSEICLPDFHAKDYDDFDFVKLKDSSNYNSGLKVRLTGYLSYNFENIALYPNTVSTAKEAVWLNFKRQVFNKENILQELNGKEVVVTGILNFLNKGHLNLFLASIDSVNCINLK